MKSTGIIRNVDSLGRIVIPVELREMFGIKRKDPIEIFVDNSAIVLKKYVRCCEFCNNDKKLVLFNNRLICQKCIKEMLTLIS